MKIWQISYYFVIEFIQIFKNWICFWNFDHFFLKFEFLFFNSFKMIHYLMILFFEKSQNSKKTFSQQFIFCLFKKKQNGFFFEPILIDFFSFPKILKKNLNFFPNFFLQKNGFFFINFDRFFLNFWIFFLPPKWPFSIRIMRKFEKIDRVDPINFDQFDHFFQNPPIVPTWSNFPKMKISISFSHWYRTFLLELWFFFHEKLKFWIFFDIQNHSVLIFRTK